jgi:uncharacterized surface protein with fasciclin (FAS1) repeats
MSPSFIISLFYLHRLLCSVFSPLSRLACLLLGSSAVTTLFITMKAALLLLFLAGLVASKPVPTLRRQTESNGSLNNETTGLLDALSQANLTSLSSFFVSYPNVLQQVMDSPGLKTILAPTDEAMQGIPEYCTSNSTCYESTMLMHILNGTFNVNELQPDPTHTIGHSFLTNDDNVNLPGGNGQAVALSIAKYPSKSDSGNIDLSVGNVLLSQEAMTAKVQEALNVDDLVPVQASQVGNFSIQPIRRAMTIPGGPLSTLRILGDYSSFIQQIKDQADDLADTINGMRGVTIFAPTNDAWQQYQDSNSNLTGSSLTALILNHVVANRAVYSPLLKDQGSMVTMAGQDIAFDSKRNSVTVGSQNATITQYDIMHRGGVIHSIDGVLANDNLNSQRASQAAASALNSTISGVAGPVSVQNAASSQGDNVPASITATNGQMNANSTVLMSEGSKNSSTQTGQSDDARRTTSKDTLTITLVASLLTLSLLLTC